ncbi:hypothetical protein ACQR53_09030 [Xanthomonas oryzae]|uniref:Uncharacterized protein n=1 Tax=Xanthomonas oryzae pv. leersiae TaxID=3112258 RepID=A0AAJ6GUT6_9XANT|nr:hypothetical protein [Xanthomonas oryzae]WIX08332.1 hypothetical protein QN060_10480 [Xanthomonas oryzae pv. oryzae]
MGLFAVYRFGRMEASIGVDAIRDAGDRQSAVCLVRGGVEIVEVRALSSGVPRPANPSA